MKDEVEQKNNYLEIVKQGHIQAQEKNNALEARITSLEQLNSTLSLQLSKNERSSTHYLYNLEEKSKELSGNVENAGNNVLQRSRDLVNMKVKYSRDVFINPSQCSQILQELWIELDHLKILSRV